MLSHTSVLGTAFALGLPALAGLIFFRRDKLVPTWFGSLLFAASRMVTGVMAWTANLGGQIRHTGIRSIGHSYNDLPPWLYHQLVTVFGGGRGLEVWTEGESEDALEKAGATDGLVFIEIHTARLDCPDSLRSAGRPMAKANQID